MRELRALSRQLKIETVLKGWRSAVQVLGARKDAHAFLLISDSTAKTIRVRGFSKVNLAQATEEYLTVEKQYASDPGVQAVLVSVESLATLRSAYPNYYLDTSTFLGTVRRATRQEPPISKSPTTAFSNDTISVQTGKGVVAIDRARVRRVQVRSHALRARIAVIGAAVSVAVGAVVDQTLGAYLRNETGASGRAVTYIAPIALFGGIAALVPPYRTVYHAR